MKIIEIIKIAGSALFGTRNQKHDIAGWGYPNGIKEKDQYGFQDTYNCKFCNLSITQDSTGAWFHLP